MINLEKFLDKYYKEDDKIIVACSTGPDSMFLLYKILETKYNKNLVVCYFNHKTRIETGAEEYFIKQMGKEKGFLVETTSYDFKKNNTDSKNKGFEERARDKRHEFFEKILKKYNAKYILKAHHLDDKIETFFFNLARGSKLTGLINMTEYSGNSLRPLLNLEKKDILKYLDKNNLKYNIDSTNANILITRNYLRHNIIPSFKKINPNFKKHINNTLAYFEELKENIDKRVKEFLTNNETAFAFKDLKAFNVEAFKNLSKFMQKEVIRYIYYITNGNSTIGLSKANIAEIIKFINSKGNKTKKEIKNLKMEKDNKLIFYTSKL